MGDSSRRSNQGKRILGIDPGTVVTGWGVVEAAGGFVAHVAHGAISTAGSPTQAERLSVIYRGLKEVCARYRPQGISLEKVFFARNAQSALKLGQARGVALLSSAHEGVPVYEYASSEIKLAVVGYGRATKEQMQRMVASLLHLDPDIQADAADALAAAICHLHQMVFQFRIGESFPWKKVGIRP